MKSQVIIVCSRCGAEIFGKIYSKDEYPQHLFCSSGCMETYLRDQYGVLYPQYYSTTLDSTFIENVCHKVFVDRMNPLAKVLTEISTEWDSMSENRRRTRIEYALKLASYKYYDLKDELETES